MSLYYEAAQVLTNADNSGGSLKSRLYKQTNLKSSPAQLFALISETSKWSLVLKDVIEKCDLLGLERKVNGTSSIHHVYITNPPSSLHFWPCSSPTTS
jgi:putative methyltransferase